MKKGYNFIDKIRQRIIVKKNRNELLKICYDYRHRNEISTKNLIDALKKSENKDANEKLGKDKIVRILITAENIVSIGLSIYLVSRLEIKDEKINNRLLILLNHEDELVRRISARLLTEIGTVQTLNAVVAGNKHGHAIRTQAAAELREMGEKASAAIPGLIALLRYKEIGWKSHFVAQCALSEMGEDAKIILLDLIDDQDKTMREHAATTLEMMNPSEEIQKKISNILSQETEG